MPSDKLRQRLKALFADLERLAADPSRDAPEIRREIEALRARLLELEAQFLESEKRLAAQEDSLSKDAGESGQRSASFLYEKDHVGYVFNGEKLEPLEEPDSALWDGNDSITVPLTASGRTIGEMRVATSPQRSLTPEEITLADAVARQVSLQIQNLRLLTAAERARVEAQEATRQFIHKNWESFLDAIQRDERVGYIYNQAAVEPCSDPPPVQYDCQETIHILDEHVGGLFIKADPHRPLTQEDKTLINAVARQIGQQVENIRLLADAARARAAAEEATRRFTRENWETYTRQESSPMGFAYDSNRVFPLRQEPIEPAITFEQPLIVRGELIGQLAIAGMQNISQEAKRLTTAVAAQTSIHLENLRLTEELQKRAAELQELDRLKSAFLANMSHELRTPLNSILGFADVLIEGLDGPLTENMINDLKLIQKNGQHLLHLINDVLDMAKIEAGRMSLTPERFRIHDLLEEVVSITSPLASEKNLVLFIESDSDGEVDIFADRTRLRQVMLNLVNNAMKFTEKGKISLCARRAEDRVTISVRDSGAGIPPEKLEEIFQEFTQVDTSTTRRMGGTGLGLPISRRLIEMHGGRLWAESSGIPGEGAAFFVELPLEAKIAEPLLETQEK